MTILDDTPLKRWDGLGEFKVGHLGFDLKTEAEILASHDIAILPKYPGPWGKCKSNNKDLSAFAAGLPVLRGDDYLGLLRFIDDPVARQVAGDGNRQLVEGMYQSKHHAEKLMKVLEGDDAAL